METRKKGFTLIELLVVIAIIALLLAILMPALGEVKKRAQAVICRSNLKQWGLIFALYAQDNEQSLPQSAAGGRVNATEAYWPGATLPYYQSTKIRHCPSTKIDKSIASTGVARIHGGTLLAWGAFPPSNYGNAWWDSFDSGSYSINEWCANPPEGLLYWGTLNTVNAWRKIAVKRSANVPLMLDGVYVSTAPRDTNTPLFRDPGLERWDEGKWGSWKWEAIRLNCIDRHKRSINGVFLDMSARKVGLKELWKFKWHKSYDTGNPYTRPDATWPDWMTNFK